MIGTSERQSFPLVLFKHLRRFQFDRLVAVRFRFSDFHGLAIHFKPIHLLYCIQARLLAVKNYEGLTLPFHTALSYDVKNGAVRLEDNSERFLQCVDLNALFEIADLENSA